MGKRIPRLATALFVSFIAAAPCGAAEVTFAALLDQMTDLDRLTRISDPPYTNRQFSSYDRNSTDPAVLTDDNWFANGDRGQYLRTEDHDGAEEYVLMDAEGPGAITRFWSANPDDAGIVRIFLDRAETPAIEMPLTELLGGKAPFAPEPLGGTRGRGWNLFLPIPYATHCKVTTSKPDFYYHINYRTYPAGTALEPFSTGLASQHASQIRQIADQLAAPHAAAAARWKQRADKLKPLRLSPGESQSVEKLTGARAITGLRCDIEADDLEAALRTCILQIRFDDLAAPAIDAPLGDFFGTAPGPNPYHALPCGVLENGVLYANWVMPFATSAIVELTNHGKQKVVITIDVDSADRPWTDDSLYFFAQWRGERNIPTQPRRDWNFLTATGRGRFVGTMMHITNPVKAWWGEGDEKIYVDGETFPSHFGTGSEDYFSYAWCDNSVFTHAYHNQPRVDGPGNYGQTCVSRFHILDDIPFASSFRFDMEVWHWADTKVSQSAISYWYAAPASTHNVDPPASASGLLDIPPVPELPVPKRVTGALEGEGMRVVENTGGHAGPQESDVWGWSNNHQMWWVHNKDGAKLTLGFNVEKAGMYDVLAVFTKAPDFAIATVAINGAALPDPFDFYHTSVIATPETSLGHHALTQGENTFSFTITGANSAALPARMTGLDYLRLVPVEP